VNIESEDFKLDSEQLKRVQEDIIKRVKDIEQRPFRVSVIGQTGVGKSSLINALFGTKLKTNAVQPCTKEIEEIPIKNPQGNTLLFYDLPGIGESEEADSTYLQRYREHLEHSDVVLWAIHADNRSVMFDLQALKKLINDYDRDRQAVLVSKLTFVLTKADVLHPPAWRMLRLGKDAKFLPSEETAKVLEQKAEYYQRIFLKPYGDLLVSKTYNDCNFSLPVEGFSFDSYLVYYNGYMDLAKVKSLKEKYPRYSEVFDRLHQNYQVIPCSSLFRFNLNKLMLVTINKLGHDEATLKLKSFLNREALDSVSLDKARQFCNLVVLDPQKRETLFDFAELSFEPKWRLF